GEDRRRSQPGPGGPAPDGRREPPASGSAHTTAPDRTGTAWPHRDRPPRGTAHLTGGASSPGCRCLGVQEIDLDKDQVIEVPVLFTWGEDGKVALALTGNMVNMLVVGDRLIVPKPYGPLLDEARFWSRGGPAASTSPGGGERGRVG